MTTDDWTVERHLDGKPDVAVDLFHRFRATLEGFGPVALSPSKSTVSFKGSRRGFAGAHPTATGLRGYFDLQRDLLASGTDLRITSTTPYTSRLFVHQFRLTSADQLDETFVGWLAEAYAVGQGAHLSRRLPSPPS